MNLRTFGRAQSSGVQQRALIIYRCAIFVNLAYKRIILFLFSLLRKLYTYHTCIQRTRQSKCIDIFFLESLSLCTCTLSITIDSWVALGMRYRLSFLLLLFFPFFSPFSFFLLIKFYDRTHSRIVEHGRGTENV